jgi:hypothetical protein
LLPTVGISILCGLARPRAQYRVIRRLGLSRRQLFDTVDRPALAPLPGRA